MRACAPGVLLLLAAACKEPAPRPEAHAAGSDAAASRAAFLATYPVFLHPRCVNCHPAGDFPLQCEESLPHGQNVRRGPDGKGEPAQRCASCHQDANLPGENMPPGNPNWHLPQPGMPLVFEGRTPAGLARQLKDPAQNGGRTLADLVHHLEKDSLVLWGWDPGEGRAPPPLPHAEFVARFREWVETGAAIPE